MEKEKLISLISTIEEPEAIEYIYYFVKDFINYHSAEQTIEQSLLCVTSVQELA